MEDPGLVIRHGKLIGLEGPPRRHGPVTIAAARVNLLGSMFQPSHRLSNFVERISISADVRRLLLDRHDAPWVRGRVQRLFLAPVPPAGGIEKAGLYAGFVAVLPQPDGTLLGVPFACMDYYLKTALMFSHTEDPPPPEVRDRIAEAFWSLLLQDPHDLPDYRDKLLHVGAGIWLLFGIEAGLSFIEEHNDEPRLTDGPDDAP